MCDKLLSLFKRLVKRFTRALSSSNQAHNGQAVGVDHSDRVSEADTDVVSVSMDASAHDLSIYEEVLRMLLEIINSCLASQMIHNPNLIYTLLYNSSIFEPFQSNPSFQDVLANIELVISYFTKQIQMQSKEETPSVSEVYRIIEDSSKKWTSEKLQVCDNYFPTDSSCSMLYPIFHLIPDSHFPAMTVYCYRISRRSSSSTWKMISLKSFSSRTSGLSFTDHRAYFLLHRISLSSIRIGIWSDEIPGMTFALFQHQKVAVVVYFGSQRIKLFRTHLFDVNDFSIDDAVLR